MVAGRRYWDAGAHGYLHAAAAAPSMQLAPPPPPPPGPPSPRRPTQDSDPAGWWEETFNGHTDSKPKGPEALSLDLVFPGFDHVYGLPERATALSLQPTTNQGEQGSGARPRPGSCVCRGRGRVKGRWGEGGEEAHRQVWQVKGD